MPYKHKHKTLATLIAVVLGGSGAHRFYIYGRKDFWAWIYFAFLLLYLCVAFLAFSQPTFYVGVLSLFPLSVYAGFIEGLTIGLTSDEKWDAIHNLYTNRRSSSGWPLVVLLVLTMSGGFVAVVASMARATDLFHTGGAYG